MTVRDRLILNGCREEDVLAEIFKGIYPRRLRWWWRICMFCSSVRSTPEIEFVRGLAHANSLREVSDLHWDYRHALSSEKTLFMKPNRGRVRSYFKKMTRTAKSNSVSQTELS